MLRVLRRTNHFIPFAPLYTKCIFSFFIYFTSPDFFFPLCAAELRGEKLKGKRTCKHRERNINQLAEEPWVSILIAAANYNFLFFWHCPTLNIWTWIGVDGNEKKKAIFFSLSSVASWKSAARLVCTGEKKAAFVFPGCII